MIRRFANWLVSRTGGPTTAALDWQPIRKLPPVDTSILVRSVMVGPVYDVAVFLGRQPDGTLRWILADIDIAHEQITHWALIQEPSR